MKPSPRLKFDPVAGTAFFGVAILAENIKHFPLLLRLDREKSLTKQQLFIMLLLTSQKPSALEPPDKFKGGRLSFIARTESGWCVTRDRCTVNL
jgi:hypothetical protein